MYVRKTFCSLTVDCEGCESTCLADRKPSVWSSQVEHGGEGFKCQKTLHVCFSEYHTISIAWLPYLGAILNIQLNKGHLSSTSDRTGHGIATFHIHYPDLASWPCLLLKQPENGGQLYTMCCLGFCQKPSPCQPCI